VWAVVGRVLSWFPGGYEGSRRYSPDRSTIYGQAQDARYDAPPETRLELLHKARYWERNNGIVNRLADLFEQFTVGPQGLQILPDSSDDQWNASAKQWWDEWCQFCDLTSLANFGTVQSLVARSWFVDGEIFIRKVNGVTPLQVRTPGKPIFRPRIQLIEGHRIETPPEMVMREGSNIIDGVEVNEVGRPVAYWFRTNTEVSYGVAKYERIPAEEMIHVFEPSRPGQVRGLPFLYPVMTDLHDLDDLQVLEMRAAKDAAEKSTFITTQSGEVDVDALRRARLNVAVKTDVNGTDTLEERTKFIRQTIGGRTFVLKTGEDVKQFLPQRPSVATAEYWTYLTSKICAGVGISHLLVFPRSLQGTVARGELDIANAFFRSRSAVLADVFRRVYVWVMEWAVKFDGRLDGAPADRTWQNCSTRAPRAVNVDVGRNSSAMLAELEQGATTYHAIYAPLGLDEKTELRRRAREEKYIDELSAEFGLSADRIRKSVGETLKAQMLLDEEKQKKDDEELLTP